MIYDNSSTHNLKQITRKTKNIVEILLQLIPRPTDTNKNLSKWGEISEAVFFFFKLNPPAFSQDMYYFNFHKCLVRNASLAKYL